MRFGGRALQTSRRPEAFAAALARRILGRASIDDPAVLADLAFLMAWDQGAPPCLSGILRMRQICRADRMAPEQGA